jgi:hypothetical protein
MGVGFEKPQWSSKTAQILLYKLVRNFKIDKEKALLNGNN